ncbi:unnamed protein product [Durusdinium trenchii]|uniref:Uncharacterized protein n=1 Tax=Durusdinium trenchii TaxID=1381693 RepID=A0ABP0RRA0_9DINO
MDKTGGPRGQLAVHPAVGQFILDNAASDKRSGLDAAQKVLLDAKAATSWPTGYSLYVKNGYMGVPSCPKANQDHVLRCLEASLHHMRCICAKDVPSCGLRPDLQGPSTTKHKVSMVYASAIPVKAYLNAGNLDVPFQEEVGRLVIVSQYFGALRLAYEAAKPGTKQKIFLMPLGGGVFNNRAEVILGALGTALDLLAQHLKVDPAARTASPRSSSSWCQRPPQWPRPPQLQPPHLLHPLISQPQLRPLPRLPRLCPTVPCRTRRWRVRSRPQ